jgi:hypothetical protein
MPTYNPLTDRFLTVATVKTKNGQKDVRVVLDIDTNIFYTLDDDGNFIPIAYSQTNPDVFVSGGTYNNNTFTYTNTTGGTFSVNFDTLTGLTVTGIISATTISGGTLYGDGSNLTGIDTTQTAFYQESVWTSFQSPSRNVGTTNFGSGGALAVPFMVNREVTILNSRLECTGISTNPTNCEFAIYDVISGVVTNRLFRQVFQVTATGLYTFPTNITLQPGIYAWATTQDIILGWRSFTLPENALGVAPTMGTNVFISGKSKASNTLPNPYGTQADNFGNLPLAIFEITI